MYCIKCGVELADSEKVCPLCGTRVYHPDIEIKTTEPPFPEYKLREPRMNLRGIMFIVTMIFAALIVQLVICNISISNASEWSGYAIGAVLLLMSSLRSRFGSNGPTPYFCSLRFCCRACLSALYRPCCSRRVVPQVCIPRCRCIRIARYGGCNTAEIRSPRTSLHLRRRTYRTRNLHDIFGNDDKYCLFRKNSASAQLVILPLVRMLYSRNGINHHCDKQTHTGIA